MDKVDDDRWMMGKDMDMEVMGVRGHGDGSSCWSVGMGLVVDDGWVAVDDLCVGEGYVMVD